MLDNSTQVDLTSFKQSNAALKFESRLHSVQINPWRDTNFSISFSTPALLSMPGWVAELFCVVSREARDQGQPVDQ